MRISDWSSDVCSSDLTYDPNLKTQAFPNGAADIDPYRSYRSMFDGSVRPENNTELIYFANRVDVDDRFAFPAGGLGGNSTLSVTQDMVDAFRMSDGRLYSEATPAEKSGEAVGSGVVFSGRSEGRRGGQECVRRCRCRWQTNH